ncbi:MAG: rRNA maturation RNAse YbeY, partial [Anaerolineae bacterium]|nr:rRNA maturation RNAse YbeY [Anaerolineae bacterium]
MTNSEIEIINEPEFNVNSARLIAAAAQVISQEALEPDTALTIVMQTDEYITRLNQQFRGLDSPTDVLSFPAELPPEEMTEDEPP